MTHRELMIKQEKQLRKDEKLLAKGRKLLKEVKGNGSNQRRKGICR